MAPAFLGTFSKLSVVSARKCSSLTVKKLISDLSSRLEESGVLEPQSSAERLVSAVCNENNLDYFLARHQETVLSVEQAR